MSVSFGVSMADAAGQDAWGWVLLQPDQLMTSSMCHETADDHLADDQETEETGVVAASSDAVDVREEPVDECKDIGVVTDETASSKEEDEAVPEVMTDPSPASEGEVEDNKKTFQNTDEEEEASEGEEVEEKPFQHSPDAEKAHDEKSDEEEEEGAIKKKEDGGATRPDECVVFSVGKLKVNGIGALCSFGVVAATVCIFLVGGGKMQHHHHRQQQQQQEKIQLQFYGDDKRIQQVVQQTSRLNQAMSSVMGAGGTSTRANISFGGFYDGF